MLELDLQLASDAPAPSEDQFRQWCALALRQRTADSELTIRLVDEAEGRELNHTWRHKDYATNVLSFPADVPDDLLDIPLDHTFAHVSGTWKVVTGKFTVLAHIDQGWLIAGTMAP